MFFLRDLPTQKIFKQFKKNYPDLDPVKTETFLNLLLLGSDLLTNLDNFLSDYGLSHGRWITLILLERRESKTALPSELAKQQGVTRATMSGLLKRLEKDKLIKRVDSDSDGRSYSVHLTKKGHNLLDKVMPPYYKMTNSFFEGETNSDLKKQTHLAQRILSNINK